MIAGFHDYVQTVEFLTEYNTSNDLHGYHHTITATKVVNMPANQTFLAEFSDNHVNGPKIYLFQRKKKAERVRYGTVAICLSILCCKKVLSVKVSAVTTSHELCLLLKNFL